MRAASQQLNSYQLVAPQHVIEAARSLRSALHTQHVLPADMAPKDLAHTVEDVNTEATLQIAALHAQFLKHTSTMHATLAKPLKDIYLSFDCGPSADALKNTSEYPQGGVEGRHQRSEAYYRQQTDARGWVIVERIKCALTAQGWTVHTGDDYPYHRVYQDIESCKRGEKPLDLNLNGVMSRQTGAQGVGDFAEALGLRLHVSGKLSSSNAVFPLNLPEVLARVCRERLSKMNEERVAQGDSLSSLETKVHVEAQRFQVVSSKYQADTDTTLVDLGIHPTQTKVDRCSPESLASTIYLACESSIEKTHTQILAPPNKLTACHWPWPLATQGTQGIDYDIQSAQQIQQSWAVVMVVSKRYMRACQDLQCVSGRINSKAVSEMRNAVWFKGCDRIVALLVDDAQDVGVPLTWRGRMGDTLRTCAYFHCGTNNFDSGMTKLEAHLNKQMRMSYHPTPPNKLKEPFTGVKKHLAPRQEAPCHGKPVAGGSLMTSQEEARSAFTDAIRMLPHPRSPPTAHDDDSENRGNTSAARRTKVDVKNADEASLLSALKVAQSLPAPETPSLINRRI